MAFEETVIAGFSETEKSRAKTERGETFTSLEAYFQIAAKATLDDANVEKTDVDGLGIGLPGVSVPYIYPSTVAETLGFESLEWVTTVDHGGSNAISLLLQSALAVDAGIVDNMLCLGADTPVDPSRTEPFDAVPRGYQKNFVLPFGTQGPNSMLAHVQNAHAHRYGTTPEQLSEIAVTQRFHAIHNPLAYFDEPITKEDYLDSRMIADPIRLLDCVMRVNGAFGFFITNAEDANRDDVVRITGFGECTNHAVTESPDPTITGIEPAGERACAMAGIEPTDVDFVQAYDDYPIIVLMQLEDLGFCEKGAGGSFVEETDLRYDGDLPLNTSGGQLSVGQPGMGAGFVQLHEGIRQLRGDGGKRQVPDAERGIVTNVGGVAFGKNLQNAGVAVLERGDG